MDEITFFAKTTFRNKQIRFGIKTDDRRRHVYLVGKTGVGKTTLMENMLAEDIKAGHGIGLIDPHGQFAEKILNYVPEERIDDVVYFNPADTEFPIGFNPLECPDRSQRHLVASGIMAVFKKIWPDVWSARMEYILGNTLLALLEFPGSTLLDVMRMLNDKDYREELVSKLEDPMIKTFWVNEFANYNERYAVEAVAAIQNKIGQFVSNPLIRNIIGQPKSTIDMREIMDQGKILIVNLAHGRIGESNSALLGAMLITRLQQAAMSRVDIPENERRDFYLYVDEFQNFSTDSFAVILSEARKYRLDLILAHQYIEQLSEVVKPAVFGNIGTIICFRVGADDAEFLEKEFSPEFVATDLVNLSKHNAYVKLMIDGVASRPFSAENLPWLSSETAFGYGDVIIEQSRKSFGTPKELVEKKIVEKIITTTSRELAKEKISRKSEKSLTQVLKPKPNIPVEGLREALARAVSGGQPPSSSGDRETEEVKTLSQSGEEKQVEEELTPETNKEKE